MRHHPQLRGAEINSSDVGNVAAGFMIALSTFFVGKIAVESIIAHRKENFSRKGQSKAAVKAKETTLDGVFKLVGMGLGGYQLIKGVPELLDEVKKLTR